MKHLFRALLISGAMMIGCGAEPTPVPPKRPAPSPPHPADVEILTKAADYAINELSPSSLKTNDWCLVVQRQTLIVEEYKDIHPFDISANEKGYLELKGVKDTFNPIQYHHFASLVINYGNGRPKSEVDDFLLRNRASSFIPSISISKCNRLVERRKIDWVHNEVRQGYDDAVPHGLGLLRLTLPGFSESGTNACLYLEFYVFGPNGRHRGLFFDLVGKEWMITKAEEIPLVF